MLKVGIHLEQLEGTTFVEMPNFVRRYLMPTAHRAGRQQEVDRRERRAFAASVGRLDAQRGAKDLAIKPAFGMRCETERLDQFGGTWMHQRRFFAVGRDKSRTASLPVHFAAAFVDAARRCASSSEAARN